MPGDNAAAAFCLAVSKSPTMTNATARLGAWLIGAAIRVGGFPLELTVREITEGFTRHGHTVEGTGSRHETVKASIEWLEEHGYLTVEEGAYSGFGHRARVYHMKI